MLLLSHSTALLFNAGKVIVTKNPYLLNYPQIIAFTKYLFKLIILENNRTSFFAIIDRNIENLNSEIKLIENLIIDNFDKPIIFQ
jgi:hypothetical protein